MEYIIENLTKEDAAYIGEKINEIVPREVDSDEEEFVLKIENEDGEIVGGCVATAFAYHWMRRFMIDKEYQNKGYGKEAMKLALDFIRTFPCGEARYCWLSYNPENA